MNPYREPAPVRTHQTALTFEQKWVGVMALAMFLNFLLGEHAGTPSLETSDTRQIAWILTYVIGHFMAMVSAVGFLARLTKCA